MSRALELLAAGRSISGGTGLELGTIALLVGATAAVAGTGITIASAIQTAEQESDLASAVAQQKTIEAQQVRESAAAEEQASRRQARLLIGKQRAVTAAAGIDVSRGSPILQEIDFIQQAELEALGIRRAGALASTQREFEASISQLRGRAARATVPFSVAGGVLSGASSLANIGLIGSSRRGSALSQLVSDGI
ncbi:MAG: hypothetical protein MN733_32755 [Nitrososphaera sp.]|nr:hypothetical protein [Nitrososphaera sp.]